MIRTATGARQVRIHLTPEEDVTVLARLTRDGKRLGRVKSAVTAGRKTVRMDLPRSVKPGAATLALRLTDAAGNRRDSTRSVHVPKRKAA